jgi:hypothetical protein
MIRRDPLVVPTLTCLIFVVAIQLGLFRLTTQAAAQILTQSGHQRKLDKLRKLFVSRRTMKRPLEPLPTSMTADWIAHLRESYSWCGDVLTLDIYYKPFK